MKIMIKETGMIEELRYFATNISQGEPRVDQCNCAYDEVLNNEPKIERDGEGNVILTQEQYDWWSERLQQQQDLDWRIAELMIVHDASVVTEVVGEAIDGVEFCDMIYAINQALNDFEAAKNKVVFLPKYT